MAMSIATNLAGLERIAAAARNAFANLEHWLYSHSSATHRLHVVEAQEERRGREMLRLMLQAHIDSRGDGDVGDAIALSQEGSAPEIPYRHKRLRSRRLVTVFGGVGITRMEYSSPGHRNLYPLDAVLGLPARCYSYELQRRLVKAAVQNPFLDSVQTIADLTGVSVSKRSLEEILPDGPEKSAGMRKLLEAKDCFVRSVL